MTNAWRSAVVRWATIAVSLGCVGVGSAQAQTPLSGDFSVGLIGSKVYAPQDPDPIRAAIGVGLRFDATVSKGVSAEARFDLFPRREFPAFRIQGGRTYEGWAGLRFDSGDHRVQLSSTILIGFHRVTSTLTDLSVEGRTHAAVSFAFSASMAASLRIGDASFIRTEVEMVVLPTNGEVIGPIVVPAGTNAGWRVEVAVGRRFGVVTQPVPPREMDRRITVGLGFASFDYATAFLDPFYQRKNGLSGFATYAFRSWCDFESVFRVFSPRSVPTPYEGGVQSHAMGGVRSGARQRLFGEFVFIRAGVDLWSQTNTAVSGDPSVPASLVFGYRRATHPAIEFGGAAEGNLTSRVIVRGEIADHVAYYGAPAFVTFGDAFVLPATRTHTLGIDVGIGLRF